MRKMLIPIGAATAALALCGVSAVTASAAPGPVIYNYAAGWSNPAVRPHWVYIGEGGAPMAHTWDWSPWNSRDAKSAGTLWVDNWSPASHSRQRTTDSKSSPEARTWPFNV